MGKFKIERGVPIPKVGRPGRYPFGTMEVGDSFPTGAEDVITASNGTTASRACKAAHSWGRPRNKRFASRREGDGFRIWRVE